jgi:hypothetical protein
MTPNSPPLTGQHRIAGRIAAWTAVATICALALTGVALAAPTISAATSSALTAAPSASSSATPSEKPSRGARGDEGGRRAFLPRLGRPVHAEAVVKDKDGKFVTVYTQRGEVTAVSATSITLKSADGFTSTYAVSAETRIGKHRKAAKIGDVKVGDVARVIAVKSADSKDAKGIRVGKPKKDD